MSDYEEFGYDMYVEKERQAEYLADTGLGGGFMKTRPALPCRMPSGYNYYHSQECNLPEIGYRHKYPVEIKNEIFDTLTVKECQILNNVRYDSPKEDIEEYVEIIQKLINMGMFDDVPVDTHENVINRYGQMKINPWSASTCGTCVACDNECEEAESDCDDDDQSEDDTSIVKKRELVLTDAFETRLDYNRHNNFMRHCADYEESLSDDIGIDDSDAPVYYSSIFETLTTIVRIRLEDVVDRTKAINMVMKFLSFMYDESNSVLVIYCDSDDACGLEDWISTVYNDKIRHNLIGAPDNICGIRVELPHSKMIAIPFVLHVMSYLWSDTDIPCK